MSKCTQCNGTGTTDCPTCHGQGYSSRVTETGEEARRLCTFCGGARQIRCSSCRGTGEVMTRPAAAPTAPAAAPRPAQNQPDRLAGRWKGDQGTWYEFVPDGNRYRATAGGPRGISGTGTATLVGHKVNLDANDALCGHYSLELNLQGNHMDGIDRKAGFPIPVYFVRA